MKLVILSVRDIKINSFQRPFYAPTVAAGVRAVTDEVNRPGDGNMLNSHPGDFELFELGSYDEETGMFDTGVPKSVVLCSNLVRG